MRFIGRTTVLLSLVMNPAVSFSPPRMQNIRSISTTTTTTELAASSDRRDVLKQLLLSTTTTAGLLGSTTILQSSLPQPASAYEQAYPVELGFENGDTSRDLQALRVERIARKKKSYEKSMEYVTDKNPLLFRGPKDILTCTVWGSALWLLTGSRSNPFVTPLANLIYDENEEGWLHDRNQGLFAPIPLLLYAVLAVVFFSMGILTDRIILLLAEGSANVSLQLATVCVISGASLELGRLASGEKRPTRPELDRSVQLRQEFNDFAVARLQRGGSCHRNEVVRAFRRYFAKYRQEDDTILGNLEIERLLREWNAMNGGVAEMTSAGFYNGLSINEQADVFVQR